MGEVYRAQDPRLGRDVALEVLPAAMASDPARLERFTREARAIAALNHPHIVTIYSTEEEDGIRFLTMQLVEGQPLDALIPPTGLARARFFELALPLADALTAAHQKQMTHRDLKPANVMAGTDGRAKCSTSACEGRLDPLRQPRAKRAIGEGWRRGGIRTRGSRSHQRFRPDPKYLRRQGECVSAVVPGRTACMFARNIEPPVASVLLHRSQSRRI
jgi:serine/threonine protein kinase